MKIEVDDARRRLRAMNASLPMCLHVMREAHGEEAVRMVRAWAGVRSCYRRGWTLAILGTNAAQMAGLAAAARQFAVAHSVRLMPMVTREDAAVLVAAADVMACPDGEGQPDAFTLDAMRQGKSAIIGDRPAARGSLQGAAWFVDPQDTAAISRSLSRLLSDPLLRRELGQSAALRACSLSGSMTGSPTEDNRTAASVETSGGAVTARAA